MSSAAESPPSTANRSASGGEGAPFVVGIGASAGGLKALQLLFRQLPEHPGISVVVVVHLSPEHESHLVELLQPACRMPVRQVNGIERIEPDTVYVIPPNANLNAVDTHLRLSRLEPERARRAPIDHFLRTLASSHDGRTVGVILTGAGSDGALGLRRVKERGGLTIAQDPEEAEHDGMPRSAIATGAVDLVLPLRLIGTEVLNFCRTRPHLPAPEDEADSEEREGRLAGIVEAVRAQTGKDIGVYRPDKVLRNVRRRMRIRHVENVRDYDEMLRRRQDEARALAKDLLSSFTEFFRGPVFTLLEQKIVPQLVEHAQRKREPKLRAWTLGCSTGEEAYSLAILLLEEIARRQLRLGIRMFATDFTEDTLARARAASYPKEISEHVSPERLEKFFSIEQGQYRVARSVRELVVVSPHDLLRDPPYAHLDLVLCQGLMRDLRSEWRTRAERVFHFALEPDGILLLGPDEEIDEGEFFRRDAACVYLGRSNDDGARRGRARLSEERLALSGTECRSESCRLLHDELAEAYSPASILIDAQLRVLHYSPRAGRYVRLPGGEPTTALLRLLDEPLRSAVREGVERCSREGKESIALGPLRVATADVLRRVIVHVRAGQSPRTKGLYLIVLEELEQPEPQGGKAPADAVARIRELEAELALARRRLERLEAANVESHEGLASTNELLQSTNEELRSVLDELQSSKEELQTANEELLTVDAENRRRLEELAELSNDLKHLMEATGIATLFVNGRLEIVRYTEKLAALFRVRATDCGRPLSDLTHLLDYPELLEDARAVIASRKPIEREVRSDADRWYLTRLSPYRAASDASDGAVITFVDITARRRAEDLLREADRRKDEFLATLAHELRNPLAPIAAGLEVLEGAGDDVETLETVRSVMTRQMHQLVRLVDDLLDVSRVSGGRLRLRKSRVDARDVVRDAVVAVSPLMTKAGHDLRVELPDRPLMLWADGARLTQVLTNLLNNAARYTPEGGRIRLAVEPRGTEVVMSVEDTGIGMTADVLERVFEPFFSHAGRGPGGGLGIGLTLAHRLVQMHAGTLTGCSEGCGRGSRFTVRLPSTDTEAKAAEAKAAEAEPAEADGPSEHHQRDHKVLIVDDNADAAETLGLLVRRLGMQQVATVSSGIEALRLGARFQPDILLLDLGMPELDGFELARRIRRARWSAASTLVAVTGWGQAKDRARTKEAGFDDHLVKPADTRSLEAVILRHEARHEARRAAAERAARSRRPG